MRIFKNHFTSQPCAQIHIIFKEVAFCSLAADRPTLTDNEVVNSSKMLLDFTTSL